MKARPTSAIKHPELPLWATADGVIWGPRGARKAQLDKYGYLRVSCSVGGKHRKIAVHKVVAGAFFGVSSMTVNHKDGDKLNNSVDNLEYLEMSENISHSFKTGLRSQCIPVLHDGVVYYSKREFERKTGLSRKGLIMESEK